MLLVDRMFRIPLEQLAAEVQQVLDGDAGELTAFVM
jgi:hypothetical protein